MAPTSTESPTTASTIYYRPPGWIMRKTFTPFLNFLMRRGVSVWGSRVLEHTGRQSGKAHHTPVNLLSVGQGEYLVSARGETQWVRNVRAAQGRLVLILGRRRQECTAEEVPLAERPEILRAYLARWKFEVGMFFDGVGPDSSDAEFAAIAARHPVFVLR
jgi:deazaflavin-dependent oxidoreductase (nitroreductase family)